MNVDWIKRAQTLDLRVQNLVNGRLTEPRGDALAKLSPRDGGLLYRFGQGTSEDVEEAVASARRAFDDGRWSKLPAQRRKDVLHRLASLIEDNRDELALMDCIDVGKPISVALTHDVAGAAGGIRFAAEAVDKCYGQVYGTDESSLSYQLRRPLGVVVGIVGWNFPLLLAAGKIGPALAAGNSMVLKPSELTSLSARQLGHLALEAGVPEGVLNVVHGGPDFGATLVRHRNVDMVTFTGSSRTGKHILVATGQSTIKRLILECGGKAPNIVFDDSPNLEAVAEAVMTRAFYNQGEVCSASSRLLVQESIKSDFLKLLIRKASMLAPGDPLKEETTFGALVSESHKNKVLGYIESGEREGAKKVHQGNLASLTERGFYVPPVIFDRVSTAHKIGQEEIFGPVLSVISFRDEEEATTIANDTIYGLSAILWTTNMGRAHRLTQGIKAGWIIVNATARPAGGPGIGVMSIGGHKESGLGVEGGTEGLEGYMSKTAVQIFS
jgi:acyl-CoA reductase-like NAD-dependent aldehyde dehydrogenase